MQEMKKVFDGKGFVERPYKVWLKDFPYATEWDVIIQRPNGRMELSWVGTHYQAAGDKFIPHHLVGGHIVGPVVAYMYVPTIDIDRVGWHGDYTDGKDPYIISVCPYLISLQDSRGDIALRSAIFFNGKWLGVTDGEVLGWRNWPEPYK